MGAPDLLRYLLDNGFDLDAVGDRLMVTPASKLTDGDRVGIRILKAELLALLSGQQKLAAAGTASTSKALASGPDLAPSSTGRTCNDCQHVLPLGTCAEPVDAGLAETFGIRWAPEGYAAGCQSFNGKLPDKPAGTTQHRRYRLMPVDGDRCHDPCWDDTEIARFMGRQEQFMRLGMAGADADDLAERLVLRDRGDDDRTLCFECGHFQPGHCGNHLSAKLPTAQVGTDLATTLQRCAGFQKL